MCCAACLTSPFRLISKRQHQLGAGIQRNIDALGSPDVLCLEVLDVGRGEDGADGGDRLGPFDCLGSGARSGRRTPS